MFPFIKAIRAKYTRVANLVCISDKNMSLIMDLTIVNGKAKRQHF